MNRRHGDRNGHAGFTLVEASIVVVLTSVLSIMIFESMRGLANTQVYTRGQANVLALAERVLQDVARDVRFASRVFFDHPDDTTYLGRLALPQDVLAGSRRPTASVDGVFVPDTVGEPETGNLLVFAAAQPNALLDLSIAMDGSDPYRIDVARFIAYYLSRRADDAIDLGRWASRPIARHADLIAISDLGRRARAVQRLFALGISIAWDSKAPVASAFYRLNGVSGAITSVKISDPPPVVADPEQSVPQMLVSRRGEIAKNGTSRVPVPRFAVGTAAFPHGFEVKIDGSGSGRLMLVRLVLSMRQSDEVVNVAELTRLVGLRDG